MILLHNEIHPHYLDGKFVSADYVLTFDELICNIAHSTSPIPQHDLEEMMSSQSNVSLSLVKENDDIVTITFATLGGLEALFVCKQMICTQPTEVSA